MAPAAHDSRSFPNEQQLVVLAVPTRAIVAPHRVFRGDSRAPSAIFKEGFQTRPEAANSDIAEYALHNVLSPWVGCTDRAHLAAGFPQRAKGCTWVYEITAPGRGIRVNGVLSRRYVFRAEREIIFIGSIPPSRIRKAVWWSWGSPTGRVAVNPSWEP